MDSTLKAYILEYYTTLGVEKRRRALCAMKFERDRALSAFSLALPYWAMDASKKAGTPVHEDLSNDPAEVLAVLREHFAAEFATITQLPQPQKTSPITSGQP